MVGEKVACMILEKSLGERHCHGLSRVLLASYPQFKVMINLTDMLTLE